MNFELNLEALSPPARRALAADTPAPLKLMAAKGVLPGVKPQDLVTLLCAFTLGDDPTLQETAQKTLAELPEVILNNVLSQDLQGAVIHSLCLTRVEDPRTVEHVLRMPQLADETLVHLSERASEVTGEIIAVNEQRLLKNPVAIEKLYLNKRVRMSTADRLLELAVRHGVELGIPAFKEAAAAITEELIAEPTEEPSFDDQLFLETAELAEAIEIRDDEDTFELDDEGNETVREKVLPLYARIGQMTPSQKIRTAMLGSATERLLLVRDPNRLVAAAAIQSPKMRENEAVQISASRSVSEDVLRQIARNREFTRSYQVKMNLATNPRTPLTFASSMIPHLRDTDLRNISRSKNVTGSISRAARQQLMKKDGKK